MDKSREVRGRIDQSVMGAAFRPEDLSKKFTGWQRKSKLRTVSRSAQQNLDFRFARNQKIKNTI